MISPFARNLLLAIAGGVVGTVGSHLYYAHRHPAPPLITFVQCTDSTLNPNPAYLEYKADGAVWARWTDGRFLEVVPK